VNPEGQVNVIDDALDGVKVTLPKNVAEPDMTASPVISAEDVTIESLLMFFISAATF
jgi:hypothetical protein